MVGVERACMARGMHAWREYVCMAGQACVAGVGGVHGGHVCMLEGVAGEGGMSGERGLAWQSGKNASC